ncbi:recombinase family protein [Streptomyces viridochromogenes]|uniref:recombinase family protein n=1 Tax=Streptomyces viridochromogenes TaxID=1938 RepID=UPI00069D4411|nr:recombinase family protein [Streptomyces viridochromogenes]
MPTSSAADAPATFRRRKRASLYVRLSVAADAENLSLDGMIEDMRDLCARENLEEVALHIDDGKSGGRRDRDKFQAWLNDARTGACDVLVNPVTDRLTREGLNVAATILDIVEGKDPATGAPSHKPVRLVDCNGLDSLHGDAFRFRFVIQAEVGRSERERIRQRSRDRERRLKRAGRWGGGTAPFGYKAVPNPEKDEEGNPKGWVLVIEPAEAKAVREAADALLKTPPDAFNKVVRRMNHNGPAPRRADHWSRVTLRRVLTGDAILGRVSENGRPLRDAKGEIVAPFPPVLTLAQVTALRARLAGTGVQAKLADGRPSRVLSGLLTCHSCQADLTVHHSVRRYRVGKEKRLKEVPQITYRCPTRGYGGTCEKPVAVSAEPAEQHIVGLYLATVGHMPRYEERTTVSGLEEMAAVEEEIKEVLADLATNADADTFARLQQLQARQKELSEKDLTTRTELVPTGQTLAEYWAGAMVDDRRDLLDEAFEELTILPGKRGIKGFQEDRLIRRWAEDDEELDEDQEALLDALPAPAEAVKPSPDEVLAELAPYVETVKRLKADGVDVDSYLVM